MEGRAGLRPRQGLWPLDLACSIREGWKVLGLRGEGPPRISCPFPPQHGEAQWGLRGLLLKTGRPSPLNNSVR